MTETRPPYIDPPENQAYELTPREWELISKLRLVHFFDGKQTERQAIIRRTLSRVFVFDGVQIANS